jgi:hypothetical protein
MNDDHPITPATAGRDDLDRFAERFKAAKRTWELVAPVIDEAYEFCLPLRERPYAKGLGAGGGARRTDRLFDYTAVEAIADFASQRLEDIWPTDQKPIDLLPGRAVAGDEAEDVRHALADVADYAIEAVNNSNFRAAAFEANLDYAIATGILLVDEGDALNPLQHRALPLTEAILDVGPYGEHDALYRERKVKARDIAVLWPEAAERAAGRSHPALAAGDRSGHGAIGLAPAMAQAIRDKPDQEFEIIEGYERDWSDSKIEVWTYRCVDLAGRTELARNVAQGTGAKPFIAYNYMRVPGEIYGRGPAQIAMPEIRSANVLRELLLEHLDLSVGGLWSYEDSGVINIDTIRIQAGTIIPKMHGSAGLVPIQVGGNPEFGAIQMAALQANIRSAFFKLDLGPTDKAPMTATETMQRVADRAGRLSGPNARLISELLFQYIRRVLYILRKKGAIKLPRLDHGFLDIKPLAPITRAQAQDDILRHLRYSEMVAATGGPAAANLILDQERFADYLARKMGIEPRVLRTRAERKQLVAGLAALGGQAAPGGNEAPQRARTIAP